ncbi:MAG TPA: mevalonate kinase [Deltaproteobacteria bacterium]|nr:mevalonate kinase [Deltaproteobacteria bacterium]
MSTATGTGHGKLLLCGEHAVVYGHPAIALAIDRCTRVSVTPRPGPLKLVSPHSDALLEEVVASVLPSTSSGGYRVEIDSDLPVGMGMGSSAALSVALVRARAALQDRRLDAAGVYREAMVLERFFHGNPSGVDVAISSRGGCLWFQRSPSSELPDLEPLAIEPWHLVVLESGEVGETAAQVARVAGDVRRNEPVLQQIGALVADARRALGDPRALGPLLSRNHQLLQQLGVSTPRLDALVELALGAGALGAKLSGAGGGGVVLALVDDPQPVLAAAGAARIPALGCVPWRP